MTSSGSITRPRRRWGSWPGGWGAARAGWALRAVEPGARWAGRDSALPGPLDDRVRDQIVAETEGNPLALLELPRGLTPAELAGGFGLPDARALPGRIESSFPRRLKALPRDARRLLLVAAARPAGAPRPLV